jgi:hypothetical protein
MQTTDKEWGVSSMVKTRLQGLAAGAIVVAGLALPGVAAAQTDYVSNNEEPKVQGTQFTRTAVAPTQAARLPITGGDVAGMTAAGVAAIATGTVLVRRSRRSRATTAVQA